MIFAFLISLISFLFVFVCLFSLTYYGDILKYTPLFYGKAFSAGSKYEEFDFYSGVNLIFIQANKYTFNNFDCINDGNALKLSLNTCETCKNASNDLSGTIIIAFITLIPQIITDLARSKGLDDIYIYIYYTIYNINIVFFNNLYSNWRLQLHEIVRL